MSTEFKLVTNDYAYKQLPTEKKYSHHNFEMQMFWNNMLSYILLFLTNLNFQSATMPPSVLWPKALTITDGRLFKIFVSLFGEPVVIYPYYHGYICRSHTLHIITYAISSVRALVAFIVSLCRSVMPSHMAY
jgi:hypothetical protein